MIPELRLVPTARQRQESSINTALRACVPVTTNDTSPNKHVPQHPMTRDAEHPTTAAPEYTEEGSFGWVTLSASCWRKPED